MIVMQDVDAQVMSESEQALGPVHTQKPAKPHKPKINSNFEIWTNLDNFVSFYD